MQVKLEFVRARSLSYYDQEYQVSRAVFEKQVWDERYAKLVDRPGKFSEAMGG